MLDSFLWATIVTIMAAPFLFLIRSRGPVEGPLSDTATQVADAGRELVSPVAPCQFVEPPCHHVVPRDVAEFVIPRFRPGIDSCRIELTDPEAEFDALVDAEGVRFMFIDGGTYLEVVFLNLTQPPFGDTCIVGPGGAAVGRSLAELVGAILPPTRAPDFLRVRSEIAAFDRFNAAREVIEVWVPPHMADLPNIDVRPTADGTDSEVVIDGRAAARLCGAPDAGPNNVRIVRKATEKEAQDGRLSA